MDIIVPGRCLVCFNERQAAAGQFALLFFLGLDS